MISIASCGYFVVTSECSASAVGFAAPQVPRSAIEYDRSTSSATAAAVRRSVSTTSKSSTRELHRRRGPAAQHRVAHGADDVERLLVAELATPRLAPVELAGRAGVAHVVVAAAAATSSSREHPAQRGRAEPPHRRAG